MLHNQDRLIRIEPGFSNWLAIYLLSIHLIALLLILSLQPPLLYSAFLILMVCISLGHYWRRDLLHRTTRSISWAEWSEDRGWRLRQSDGGIQQATLTPSSYLSRYLVVLHFMTAENGTCRLLLPGDTIQPDLHRRLRVLLRLQNHFGV